MSILWDLRFTFPYSLTFMIVISYSLRFEIVKYYSLRIEIRNLSMITKFVILILWDDEISMLILWDWNPPVYVCLPVTSIQRITMASISLHSTSPVHTRIDPYPACFPKWTWLDWGSSFLTPLWLWMTYRYSHTYVTVNCSI